MLEYDYEQEYRHVIKCPKCGYASHLINLELRSVVSVANGRGWELRGPFDVHFECSRCHWEIDIDAYSDSSNIYLLNKPATPIQNKIVGTVVVDWERNC